MADRHRRSRSCGWCSRVNFFGTIARRRERHLYVAIWFYIATIITVAVLHIVNILALPVSAVQELFDLRRRAGRVRAVVVRPQRRRVLPDDAVPRHHVLLPAEGGGAAGVLATGCRSSTSGRWSSSTSGRARTTCSTRRCRTGRSARHGVLAHAVAPSWGGMVNGLLTLRGAWDKRARGSGAQVLRRRRHLLRHGDVRRADAVDQERQRARALHRLDHRARPHRRAGLERRS